MPCYHPIPAQSADAGPWQLHPQLGTADRQIPCGRCLGCRTARQKHWTTRAIHEARLWQHNTFITLTYNDDELPSELRPDHLCNFWKRLRKSCSSNEQILTVRSASIRYLACGQYGDRTLRPHYHACLFNAAFADARIYNARKNLYTSPTLDELWGHGSAKLSPFEPARAGYVAGYATKTGPRDYYDADGVVLQPPFFRSSCRPAPGREWLEKNRADLQHGYTIIDGKKTAIPRYYLKRLLQEHESRARHEDLQARPTRKSDKNDPDRLKAAEVAHVQRQKQKTRQL